MNSPLFCFLILLNLLFLPNYFAQFSPSFREFLKDEGGQELEKLLTREDLGAKEVMEEEITRLGRRQSKLEKSSIFQNF